MNFSVEVTMQLQGSEADVAKLIQSLVAAVPATVTLNHVEFILNLLTAPPQPLPTPAS